jgi:hypothetical protein
MLDTTDYRQCRRCRTKLETPISNQRSAFCCKGCHRIWYANHCVACEGPKTERHGKECARELASIKRHGMMGKFHQKRPSPTQGAKSGEACSQTPIFIGSAEGQIPVEPRHKWRIVAGPELSETSFRLATLKPHPRIKWDIDNTASIGPKDWPVNIIGGYRIRQRVIHVDFRKGRDGLA